MKSLTCFSSRSRGTCCAVILERLAENCRGRTTAIICTRTNAPKYILESHRLHFGSICDQNGRNFEPCSPPPIKLPLTALYRHAVEQVCDRRRNKWHRTGWLLARAGYVSPCCKVMCLWYTCFCAEVFFFFSVLTLYSQMEHSLGVNFFFSSLSSCKCCTFLPFPVFLFCLPRCHMYVVYVWTG